MRWRFLGFAVAAITMLEGGGARAAVTVDPVTTIATSRFTASFSFDHTVGAGVDRYLVVAVLDGNLGVAATAVSYGGAPLTRIDASRGRDVASELWVLTAPAAGTHTIAVTLDSSNDEPMAAALSFAGVDQTVPIGATGKATGSGGAISVTLPTAPGDLILDAGGVWNQRGPTASPDPSQAVLWNVFNGIGTVHLGSRKLATGATTTMSWTATGQQLAWATIAVPIRAAAPSPSDAGPDAGLFDAGARSAAPEGNADASAARVDQDAGPVEPADATALAVRTLNFRVGSACALARGRGQGALLWLAALAALTIRRRRAR